MSITTHQRQRGTRLGHATNVSGLVDRLQPSDEGSFLIYNGAAGEWEARPPSTLLTIGNALTQHKTTADIFVPVAATRVNIFELVALAAGDYIFVAHVTLRNSEAGAAATLAQLYWRNVTASADFQGYGADALAINDIRTLTYQWFVTADGLTDYALQINVATGTGGKITAGEARMFGIRFH